MRRFVISGILLSTLFAQNFASESPQKDYEVVPLRVSVEGRTIPGVTIENLKNPSASSYDIVYVPIRDEQAIQLTVNILENGESSVDVTKNFNTVYISHGNWLNVSSDGLVSVNDSDKPKSELTRPRKALVVVLYNVFDQRTGKKILGGKKGGAVMGFELVD